MPAYLGGKTPFAGLKWIASFPDNVSRNKPRASSITILNEFETGSPLCVINSALVSAIRTASVSGVIIKRYIRKKIENRNISIGITGFGPVGRMHIRMMNSLLGERIREVRVFDIRPVDLAGLDHELADKICVCGSWEECYSDADIFITCTVSAKRYVNKAPKKGSLQLNVSLRDYEMDVFKYMNLIVVDDWDEVCRENTDIENMYMNGGLVREDTIPIDEFICNDSFLSENEDVVVMFNPMGMAVFDIAIGGYYYSESLKKGIGIDLSE
jgi:ornithine cyclodeaminase